MAVEMKYFSHAFRYRDCYFCLANEKTYNDKERIVAIQDGYSENDFIQLPYYNHADIARDFLKKHNIHRFRMKKVCDMKDEEVEKACHWFYEENKIFDEWLEFEKKLLHNFAINWCKENNIAYTTKRLPENKSKV